MPRGDTGNDDTRMKVVEALCAMMKDQPIDKVKVSALCKRAGISRSTFYFYFEDIYAVPDWFWDHLMASNLYKMGVTVTYDEAHLMSFKVLLPHKEFFMNAFKAESYNSPFKHGSRMVKAAFVASAEKNLGRSFTDAEMLDIDYCNAGAAEMTADWVRHGMNASPEEMTASFSRCAPAFLKKLLDLTPERGKDAQDSPVASR